MESPAPAGLFFAGGGHVKLRTLQIFKVIREGKRFSNGISRASLGLVEEP
jgi:hypothetical protein